VPPALLLPLGFVVVSLLAQFALLFHPTVFLATPAVAVCALAGFALSFPFDLRRLDRFAAGAAAGVYAVFAAPFVLSGRATFGGYIKLDDTATYFAMLDRAMTDGYNVAGLAPSTYQATLDTSLVYGYPLGSLLPLGVGRVLVHENLAWVWQPYLTFLAVLIALALYQLAGSLVRTRWLRALIAFLGAQAALVYGYALWGGVKELSAAAVVATIAALVPATARTLGRPRTLVPLAAACAGIAGVLSVGGAVWLLPLLLPALVLGYRASGLRVTAIGTGWFVAITALLAIPAISAGRTFLSHTGAFTGGSEYGNLRGRLSALQVFGIWPGGDFRYPALHHTITHVLIAVVAAAAVAALVVAWRRRAWELPVAAAAVAFGCAVYVGMGSPWVGAKALASASPIVLTLGLAAIGAVYEFGRRAVAVVLLALVGAGVIWSNVLQYHAVDLAPSAMLSELETIGARFAGQGPSLMTDFQAYGDRHFLRDMTAEGASELRRHVVPLRTGGVATTGVTADIDEFQLDAILFYRTLVIRRSPLDSRPPSIYKLVWSGKYYDVWQRPLGASPIVEHVSLGSRFVPAAVPSCNTVLQVAKAAQEVGGMVATVERPSTVVVETNGRLGPPTTLGEYGEDPVAFYLEKPYTFQATFSVPVAGTYGIWLGGTFRGLVTATVDRIPVGGGLRDMLDWPNTYVELGAVRLQRGSHLLDLDDHGSDWRPGSAGAPEFGFGPIAIGVGTGDWPVTYVKPADARSLCGKDLDWLEAVRSS